MTSNNQKNQVDISGIKVIRIQSLVWWNFIFGTIFLISLVDARRATEKKDELIDNLNSYSISLVVAKDPRPQVEIEGVMYHLMTDLDTKKPLPVVRCDLAEMEDIFHPPRCINAKEVEAMEADIILALKRKTIGEAMFLIFGFITIIPWLIMLTYRATSRC